MKIFFPPCAGSGLRLGLGGAPLGNLFEAVGDGQARQLVDAAWRGGCRSFDTAPHYGHGLSERRLGDALR
ncbi:MAG: aldo/keto reductase, partial [Polaromonas sp.]|nr:aldo/keto reductase [Polaromonas sp.]